MASFFKTFFLGILVTLLLPLIAVVLVLFFIYCLLVFLYMSIKCIIIFFSGGAPMGDLKEDIEAKDILKKRAAAINQPIYNTGMNNTYPLGSYPNQIPPQNVPINPYPSQQEVNVQGQINAQPFQTNNAQQGGNIVNDNQPSSNNPVQETPINNVEESEFFPNKIKDDDL